MCSAPEWTRLCICVGLLWFSGNICRLEAYEEAVAETQPDWTVVIAQLREQMYRMPGHAETRRQLAVACNNYGVSLANQGHFTEATQQLEEAMRIDSSNTQFQKNLVMIHLQAAHVAYQAHRTQEAREAIDRALALDPKETEAYVLLGEIEYDSQRLKEAKGAWQKALALDPALEEVEEKLRQLNEELPVESRFERLSQVYFDIRYPEELERPIGFDIRDALLEARRSIGSDFARWPTHKLVVLVYSAEQFRQLRQETPDWVAGQYDGKIRVPLPSQDLDREAVTRILFHEYTHALVHDLTNNRCPLWFNEGLAEYEAWKGKNPPWIGLRHAFANKHLIPWSALSDQFSTALPAQEVRLAYEQSHSIVRYLIERHGFWRIRRVLKAVASDTPLETALAAELHIKLTRLEEYWRKWLEELLRNFPSENFSSR